MRNLTNSFGTLYHPQKAFVVYEAQSAEKQIYVESYDLDGNGKPYNAHPLSLTEAANLSKALLPKERKKSAFLSLRGLMPQNLLFLKTERNPYAVWHTEARRVQLYFKEELGIKSGDASVPALIWMATKTALHLFALDGSEINAQTPLFNAPFFNLYKEGKVCMGNVKIDIKPDCTIEDFMEQWQHAFFNSYFSHMIGGHNPVKGNIVQLWKGLSGSDMPFPTDKLTPNQKTLNDLIN